MEPAVAAIDAMQLPDCSRQVEILFDLAREYGQRWPVCNTLVGPDRYEMALGLNARRERVLLLNQEQEKILAKSYDPRFKFSFSDRVSNSLRNKAVEL